MSLQSIKLEWGPTGDATDMRRRTFFNLGRKVPRCFLGIGGLLVTLSLAPAAVQINVQVGHNGIVREATWFPLQCELRNDGPPISGFIEVATMGLARGSVQRLAMELPTGTLKRVVMPVFAPTRYQTSWEVRLVNARGRTLEVAPDASARQAIGAATMLVGSLSRTAAGAVSLRPIKRNQPDAQPQVFRFVPANFPGNPLLLEGVDAIYLNSTIATGLRPDQADALLAWMRAGGHLIVAIEQVTDVTGTPWLQDVLPFVPQEITGVARHGELQGWLKPVYAAPATLPETRRPDDAFEQAEIRVARGSVRAGRVEVASGGLPLLVSAPRDFGRVTVLTFSPELEPFKSWEHLTAFWTQLVGVPATLYTSTDYSAGFNLSVDGIFGSLLDSRQVRKLSVGWLLALLVVYLGVIGPFDRWWLRKIRRPIWTWITFPGYVVLFSLLIYGLGYWLRAGESEYSELHVVDVCPQGARAEVRGRTYASIYAPANENFALHSELPFATLRPEFTSGRGRDSSEPTQVVQIGGHFDALVFVPVWTSQLYLSDWWSTLNTPLVATAGQQTVTINNRTGQPLSDVYLAWRDRVYHVDPILPGATRVVRWDAPDDGHEALADFVRRDLGALLTAARQRQRAFGSAGSGQLDEPAHATTVASLLGSLSGGAKESQLTVPRGWDVTASLAAGGAVLFALTTNGAPVPSLLASGAQRTTVTTLWRVPVTPHSQTDL